MDLKYIYKICTKTEWLEAKKKGKFYGSNKDLEDGFIHFSNKDQFFKQISLCLLIFGFLIQLRTLNGAAYGDLHYSYLPVLSIIFIFLEKIYSNKSYTNQSMLILILIFLTLSITYNPYSTTRGS